MPRQGIQRGPDGPIGLNNTPIGAMIKESAVKGLRMGGTYRAENGISIAFNENTASIYQCGKLIPGARNYTLSKRGDQLAISINNASRPLVVALGATGLIAAPVRLRLPDKSSPATRPMMCGRLTATEPSYREASTRRAGLCMPTRPSAARSHRCAPRERPRRTFSPVALISSLFGGQESQEVREDQKHPTPAGPRMAGTYTAGSLKLDFHPVAVILDCGQASRGACIFSQKRT